METVDNRAILFELDEIYKYKDLINALDKDVLRNIVFKGDDDSKTLYNEFLSIVAKEVNHDLNKVEFNKLKDSLILKMKDYLSKE